MKSVCDIVLLQLPVPDLSLLRAVADGKECTNIPLAAGYLATAVLRAGLEDRFRVRILSPQRVDPLGDEAIVTEILRHEPGIVGFTCFLWNIERTLGIVRRLKRRRPGLIVLLGGPEITLDNEWIRSEACVDYFFVGEGEWAFVRFLESLTRRETPPRIWKPDARSVGLSVEGSPYLNGILRAGPTTPLFLETMRGCRYGCRFCYYPRGITGQSYLSLPDVERIVRRACRDQIREIILLDPSLNQRPDFPDFLRLFARMNRRSSISENTDSERTRPFSLFGELRAESVTPEIAGLLRDAGFPEV
ncbi:MAG: cobalamin-dependent protein, partial [Planctomycetia bacterium]|nr:cobalamin-dependent protein [Planctomycetia bacterium]